MRKSLSVLSRSTLLMENVDRIIKSKKLPEAMKLFRKAGYGLSLRVLDASYCGVPQTRKRFFLFGELGGENDALRFLPG